jgi:hypothetical protein
MFLHIQWKDECTLDYNKNIIYKKTNNNEIGTFLLEDNKIIINWNNNIEKDIFIYIFNSYYDIVFFYEYINNYEIDFIDLYYNNSSYNFILNKNRNIIIDKYDIIKKGVYKLFQYYIIIKWDNSTDDNIFYNINNKYYCYKYLCELVSNKNPYNIKNNNIEYECLDISKEIFKNINNKFYYIDEKIYKYNIINFQKGNIFNNLSILYDNINIKYKNYINNNNINNYINKNISNNLLDEMINIELDFEIPKKKIKRILSLVEWGFPPFGGGEYWLLNLNKIFHKNNYDNYLICFSDPFQNIYFHNIELIDLKYVKIIQMPKDLLKIIQLIKIIDPDLINHQGVYREYFMKISNVLEIPFLTGFCFWNNILNFNICNSNIDMLNNNNLLPTNEFNQILDNSYSYVASDFVNDIINKLYNIKLDVIETVSIKDEFYFDKNLYKNDLNYVTLINCHYNKSGHIIKYLCENLDINIPLQIIYTENDPNISSDFVYTLINNRNLKKNINILIIGKTDIKNIYNKTRILLIPYLCDETFCRVAYEGMFNKLPILSTKNGNLKYLLKNYAIFIDNYDYDKWKFEIENLYYNNEKLVLFNNKLNNFLSENIIEDKINNKLNNINESKYKLDKNNIGMIVPWADQGLGIQARDYYTSLKELGYEPHIFSFKPYHATHDNILLQSNKEEWIYNNVYYSNNYREDITYDEILDFVYKYKIKTMIIIEATFLNIFKIAAFLKIMNINIYLIVNIECIRLIELEYHLIFDKILTNNNASNTIISNIFKNNVYNLGFHLNYPYFQKKIKKNKENLDKIKFFCIGGLNSISRKNIDLVIMSFYNIFKEYPNKINNWELNVYIQGVEIPDILNKYKCNNINYYIYNNSYKSIIDKYFENDIFIHLGSHEGLGLGYYESLYSGCPIVIMDWFPGNEIVKNKINGWYINCKYDILNDNDNGLINRGIVNNDDIEYTILNILNDNNTFDIINNTIDNMKFLYNKNKKIFNKNILDILI